MLGTIFTRGTEQLHHPQRGAGNSSSGSEGLVPDQPQAGLCGDQSEAWQGLGCKSCPSQPSVSPALPRASRCSAGVGTDEMRPLGREDHPCLLEHLCPAQVRLPRSDPAPCSPFPAAPPTNTNLPLPDPDKFWRPLASGQAPLPPTQLWRSLQGHSWVPGVCPGGQGHVAEAGAGTGPCPWSSARLQLCALLGAGSNSHTELPLLLSRAALTS